MSNYDPEKEKQKVIKANKAIFDKYPQARIFPRSQNVYIKILNGKDLTFRYSINKRIMKEYWKNVKTLPAYTLTLHKDD